MTPPPTIALFAKYPRPGLAKTRLIPALGEEGAADLHRRLVERTLGTICESGLPFAVWTTGAEHGAFTEWLGDDVPLEEQGEGDLGERLGRVPAPAILLGGDVPDLAARHLREAAKALGENDAVIGPAADGGYYLLGFTQEMPFLFADMAWGTETVLRDTERALRDREVRYRVLETLSDCDRPEDLDRWPDLTA
ncbi:TIGR04282 family arsenosugar biosynthesis glycosyltransferase [Aurantiacibacter aquimixticola]|uniref:Glycosyltransferase n=1 Tax=Aurantiacibacter aquimixticola TaxID=1958945 RepID=A0A419RTW1_9SPHN|nr:TIGR04282 family arsenosugar biosynthesis glycosyltransferase [Aurantiacibacter aquimixticola]RJY09220.1 glycosyltransferase [Aurantiacibacter aquimixticola]